MSEQFIDINNWGEDGDLYWAAGHHSPEVFVDATIKFSRDLIGVEADVEEALTADYVHQVYAIFKIRDGYTFEDAVRNGELVHISFSDKRRNGDFPVTYLQV